MFLKKIYNCINIIEISYNGPKPIKSFSFNFSEDFIRIRYQIRKRIKNKVAIIFKWVPVTKETRNKA